VSRLALVAVAAAAVAVAIVASPGCFDEEHHTQAAACDTALRCYFGDDAAHQLGALKKGNDLVFSGLQDPSLFKAAYGPTGSCWNGDLALAHSCEERCRALLWQDCFVPYSVAAGADPETATPFCQDACNFPEACIQDEQGNSSVCPAGVPGNDDFVDSHCELDADLPPNPTINTGCCAFTSPLTGSLPQDGCKYTYEEDSSKVVTGPPEP
jgi:hypothetical protein